MEFYQLLFFKKGKAFNPLLLCFFLTCPFFLFGKGTSLKVCEFSSNLSLFSNFSLFSIQTGCTYSERINVKALEVGNMVSWKTSDELNNSYFLVQCSTDGITFKNVKQLPGAGTTQIEQRYQFLDVNTADLRVFYRLRQVAYDGSFIQSETVICNRIAPNNLLITSMSSVETSDIFTLEVNATLDASSICTILARDRTTIQELNFDLQEGINKISIPVHDLENGRYELVINALGELERVFIQKIDAHEMPTLAVKE